MGISKNVFLRRGVGSTLYFNQENNVARNSTWHNGLVLDALAHSFFAKLTKNKNQTFIGGEYVGLQNYSNRFFAFYNNGGVNANMGNNLPQFTPYYNTWIHITIVRDYVNKQCNIYVNGTLLVNIELPNMVFALQQLILGSHNSNGTTRIIEDGNMAFLKIYNRVPSDNEIKLLSKNYPISRQGLIGEWDLTEGSGSISYDKSGRGKNLTLSNCDWNNDKPF